MHVACHVRLAAPLGRSSSLTLDPPALFQCSHLAPNHSDSIVCRLLLGLGISFGNLSRILHMALQHSPPLPRRLHRLLVWIPLLIAPADVKGH